MNSETETMFPALPARTSLKKSKHRTTTAAAPKLSTSPSILPTEAPTKRSTKRQDDEEERLSKISRDWEFMRALPKDISQLAVMVDDPKTFGAATAVAAAVMLSDLNGHIRFRITRWLPNDDSIAPQFVRRRHRDFVALSLRLSHCYPDLLLPSLAAPFSSLFGTLTASHESTEEFLQVRARRLEAFLTTLLSQHPKICAESPDVAAFLLNDSETFDEIATRYLNNKGQDAEVAPLKLTDSLQGWVKSSFFATTSGAPVASLEPRNAEMCTELSTAYEALNTWIDDKYVAQDRTAGVERLTSALESVLFVLASQRKLKQEMFGAMLMDHQSRKLTEAWNAVHQQEIDFIESLSGRKAPALQPGPLRSMHRLACQMTGAKDAFQRNLQILSDLHHQNHDRNKVEEIKTKMAELRLNCGKTSLQVATDFAQLSFQQAVNERAKLEQVKRLLLQEPD